MLIKGNKSKKKQALAKQAKVDPTLPDQIMNFIGEEVKKNSPDKGLIDEQALDAIMGQKLSKLEIARQQVSKEEVEEQAQQMVQARAQELLDNLEAEIASKREHSEQEIAQAKSAAETQAQEILEQANEHVLNEAKKLDQNKQAFAQAQEEHFRQIENLRLEALKDAIDEAKPYVNETIELFKNLHLDKRELAQLIKDNVATIAFDVAKQILNYEVHVNDNLLEQQILHSVNKLLDSKGVMKITLNPADKDKQANLSELLANVLDTSVRLVYLYEDQVEMGSCVIETQGGKLNSSFSTQLATIKASFEQYLGHKISILPDEPLILETETLETEGEIADSKKKTKLVEESQMAGKQSNKISTNIEPSEEELMELEDNFEDIANLDIEEDLDTLLSDILVDDEEASAAKKPSKEEAKEEASLEELIDLSDSPEIGANDFANGEDWSKDQNEEEFLEDLSEKKESTEYKDEDGNTFVEYNEFEGDENFGDSGDATDERFPEY